MKGLLIAEKPSVMRAIKEVIDVEKIKDLDCAAFHGHLMGLKEPAEYDPRYKSWHDTSLMPIIPENMEYKAVDEKSVEILLQKIRSGGYGYLVNACDAGREGEHIFWSFYETGGLSLPVKRLWTSSVTKPALKQALANLQDASLYDGMRQAAKYRAQFDWLVGLNFTRAATHQLGELNSIGRVQTPTVKILVDRELEIQNFKAEDFYEVKGVFQINGAEVAAVHLIAPDLKETRFKNQAGAEAIVKDVKVKKLGRVSDVQQETKEVPAATLYSLAELQKAANTMYGFKPDKTLDLAQKLYEAGVLSYPRTESRALPTDMIPELRAHLTPVKAVPDLAQYVDKIGQTEIDNMLKGKYVDDAGITDHHAIIPTDQTPNWAGLSKDEQAIYSLVARSFLAIFMPPYKFSTTTLLIDVGGNIFKAQGKVDLDKGYTVLCPSKKNTEVELPACKAGDQADVSKVNAVKGTTKPPKRYTPRTILAAMQNAGQDLPDSAMRSVLRESAGLGTSATRADVLKKIEDRGYVEVKKNQYYVLPAGMTLIQNIGDRSLASASLTAEWEKKLMDMEKGTYQGNFRAEMEAYVKTETAHILNTIKGTYGKVIGKCPCCGGEVKDFGKFYCCENRKPNDTSSCQVGFNKVLLGHKMSEQDIQDLLTGAPIGPYDFVSKEQKKFKGQIVFVKDTGKLDFVHNNESLGKCPVCGGDVIEVGKGYICSRAKRDDPNACHFGIPHTVGGKKISKEDLGILLSGEITGIYEIKTKAGKPWKVKFKMNAEHRLDIIDAEEKKEVGKCPRCHSAVIGTPTNFYCSGKECDWSFSRRIKGANLTDKDMQDLLNGQRTREITFVWRNGERGMAKLYLQGETLQWDFD